MTTEKPAKKAPAKAGVVGAKRLSGAPRKVGPNWSLSDRERETMARSYGLNDMLAQVEDASHPDDQELIANALAATVGFHELSKLIDELEWDESLADVANELKTIRVSFELALRALDEALKDRAANFQKARELALSRWEHDPASLAMKKIESEWRSWQAGGARYRSNAAFARAMTLQYPDIKSAGSIENAIRKWREEKSSS